MDTVLITPEARPAAPKFPGFVLGWAITDLVMCLMRMGVAGLGLVSLIFVLKSSGLGPVIYAAMVLEIVSSFMLVLCGIPADIGLICRKKFAVRLAYAAIGFTVLNILIGLVSIGENLHGKSGAVLGGMIFGVVLAIAIRLALLVFYWIAVKRAVKYFAERDAASVAPVAVTTTVDAGM